MRLGSSEFTGNAHIANPCTRIQFNARALLLSLSVAALAALALAPGAGAFGLNEFDVTFTAADGATVTQAGSHPFAMTTSLQFESTPTEKGGQTFDAAAKDIVLGQLPGFVGNPTAMPRCSTADFLTATEIKLQPTEPKVPDCPDATAVGTVAVTLADTSGLAACLRRPSTTSSPRPGSRPNSASGG